MIKNLKKYIDFINERGTECKGSIYSQILKNERIKRNMTLNDLSEGICSISYLSKLENGTIKSNESFFIKLFEKVDINYNEINEENYDLILDETLKYYFNNDLNGLNNLFKKVKDLSYVVTNNIVKCFYFLKIRDYDAFIEAFKELSVIRETLGYFEANCYIFLAIEYYIKMYNFKKALYYLRSFELLENKNRYLTYLIIEANILVSAFLKVSSRLVVYYYKLIQISFAGYPNGRLMEMRMLYNLSISDEFSYDVLDDIESINFDLIPSDNRFNILFYIYLIKLKLTNYQTIFDDIYKNGYFIDSRFLGLLGYCAYWINKDENYRLIYEIIKEYTFENIDKLHQEFIYFILMYTSNVSNADIISFIRNEIIPHLNDVTYYLYNEIYVDVYMALLKDESHYKEGFNFLNNKRINMDEYSNENKEEDLSKLKENFGGLNSNKKYKFYKNC